MNKVHTLNGIANTHIVEHNGGIIVFDPGMPHRAKRILRAVGALGYMPRDVRLIVVTHGHIDHAGSVAKFKQLTGAPILMHQADVALVATPDLKIPPGRNQQIDRVGRLMRRFGGLLPMEPFVPDICPEDGDSLREYGVDARVIHTPGHTDGSLSVLFEDGTIFVGDAILNLVRVSFPLWWHDPDAARASACKIALVQPRLCYSGHGRPFDSQALAAFVAGCGEPIEQRHATDYLGR